jgi:DNA-binding LacI/PurR family transcriptional regulator
MRALLDSGVELDAVFALNDAMALGALHALHARRLDVPGAVALLGFDDVDDVRYSVPTITSVAPGREQIAAAAVELLLARIEGSAGAGPFKRVVPDSSIVGRESTGDVPEGGGERVVGVQPGGEEEIAAGP